MRQHEVDALRDGKELAWTAYVAKTGSGVFRVPRPPVYSNRLLQNVGSSEASEETTVEIVDPSKKSAVEEKPTIQSGPRNKWTRRFVMAISILAILYLAWNYL